MRFNYKTLERLIPDIPPIEMVAEKITAHLFEIESCENGMLDIKILPNRYADAACYRGLAREIAAICKVSFKDQKIATPKVQHKNKTRPVIEVPNLCRRLMTCRIEGIAVGKSPAWIQDALNAYGIRSISGIVDITNYVTLETGQPLHAFDADKMEGDELVARQAHEGEIVETLDRRKLTLNPSVLVLSDSRHALDIAGIKGGTRAEITAKTKNIVLTAGNFDSTLIYKTAKRIDITTDASIRFSHAISPALTEHGMLRALQLIQELCGGKAGVVCDAYPKPAKSAPIIFEAKRFNALTGLALTETQCLAELKKLNFSVSGKKVTPPPERIDIHRFEDIAEEIIRLHGYANVPDTPPKIAVAAVTREPMRMLKDSVQDILISLGCTEILTHSFMENGEVALENPLTAEQSFLRPSLAKGLEDALAHNAKFFDTVALFEIGSVFGKKTNHDPTEEVRCGIAYLRKGGEMHEAFRIVRGTMEELLARIGIREYALMEENKGLSVLVNNEPMGIIMRCETVRTGACAEFSLTKLLPFILRGRYYVPISKYPSIVRDASFIVEKTMKVGVLMDAAWHDAPKDLKEVRFMGIYEGAGIAAGKKSITLRFVFRSDNKTLTDDEADSFYGYVLDAMRELVAFEIK